jgi:hypothetical protein
MKAVFVAVAILVCGAFAADVYEQFIDWTIEHGKVYNNAQEHVSRYNAFKSNYALVRHLNRQGKGTFTLNKFADLTQEEFAAKYLRVMPVGQISRRNTFPYNRFAAYPDEKNWVDDGAVTEVKDQANCGSCWAFSATGSMEGAWFVAHKELPLISEQQLVDCEQDCMEFPGTTQQVCDEGCNGGLMPNAFTYAIRVGMVSESAYPYVGVDQTCKLDESKIKYHFSKWFFVDDNEDAMVAALNENGPLSVGVDATYWSFYSGGIYDTSCSSERMNHGVLLVGYGEENGTKYWIVKNSWAASWGEKGFIRLIRGKNKCGINNFVCTIVA